jgi:phosphomannomutase/phosphoglucomutase
MITASHNPGPDNGFKMMRGKASFFGADIQKPSPTASRPAPTTPSAPHGGGVEARDVSGAYIAT